MEGRVEKKKYLLADQKNINGGKVEVIKIGHGGHSFTTCVHTSIELRHSQPLGVLVNGISALVP
jgi:hypothetical protein